jgi:hypothetical protein
VGLDNYVAPCRAWELPQIDEQDAARFRKRGMAEALWIQQEGARRPVAVFVGEDTLEHENLFAIRVIM